ncbi:MAG TPA: CPBP family intramembrane glutamic endopeptidase [Vicinamibacterales bacterium]|nr:CPBP family intramembrane glutamic endopeptidase [Vicinamibacterales bacterium]
MEDTNLAAPAAVPVPVAPVRARPLPKWLVALEVVAISGIPTQIIVAAILFFATDLGRAGGTDDPMTRIMSLEFTAGTTLLDTALIALMIRVFLEISGEDSRTVFLGHRRILPEVVRGLLWLPVVLILASAVAYGLSQVPVLHNVESNPLGGFMGSPFEAMIFIIVVALGGGCREELQRAFILHRFEQGLGGIKVGLVLFSVLFASLHLPQGRDVAITVGLLGVFWGLLYIKRRSAVMSITNHAAFDVVQVAMGAIARSIGQ